MQKWTKLGEALPGGGQSPCWLLSCAEEIPARLADWPGLPSMQWTEPRPPPLTMAVGVLRRTRAAAPNWLVQTRPKTRPCKMKRFGWHSFVCRGTRALRRWMPEHPRAPQGNVEGASTFTDATLLMGRGASAPSRRDVPLLWLKSLCHSVNQLPHPSDLIQTLPLPALNCASNAPAPS